MPDTPITQAARDPGRVPDPTENVIALAQANKEREDDLRAAEGRRIDTEITHLNFVAELRATHSKEMRESEARRLDAIRQVDVAARSTEAERATSAIEALAKTTAANAETLRSLVTTTATALAAQNAESNKQQLDRISALERSSYMGAGKEAVADPIMAKLILTMEALVAAQSSGAGKSEGVKALWGFMVGAIGLLLGIFGFLASRGGP
jgi:hypothetical protein